MEIDQVTADFLQSAISLAKIMRTIDTPDEVADDVGEEAIHTFLDAFTNMEAHGQGRPSGSSGMDTAGC